MTIYTEKICPIRYGARLQKTSAVHIAYIVFWCVYMAQRKAQTPSHEAVKHLTKDFEAVKWILLP